MYEAVSHMREDLVGSGLGHESVFVVQNAYQRALWERSDLAWRRFYEMLFATLNALRFESINADARGQRAIESLLCLLDDDFGSAVIEPLRRRHLRRALSSALRSRSARRLPSDAKQAMRG